MLQAFHKLSPSQRPSQS